MGYNTKSANNKQQVAAFSLSQRCKQLLRCACERRQLHSGEAFTYVKSQQSCNNFSFLQRNSSLTVYINVNKSLLTCAHSFAFYCGATLPTTLWNCECNMLGRLHGITEEIGSHTYSTEMGKFKWRYNCLTTPGAYKNSKLLLRFRKLHFFSTAENVGSSNFRFNRDVYGYS